MTVKKYKSMELKDLGQGLHQLIFSHETNDYNVIDDAFMTELKAMMDELETKTPSALLVTSGKKDFILGADVKEMVGITDEKLLREKLMIAHETLGRLSKTKYPTIALINGLALGGGLELALSCGYRFALESQAKMGLPEVQLGIIPGFGGTKRLTDLVGVSAALEAMTSAKHYDAKKAYKMALVDGYYANNSVFTEPHVWLSTFKASIPSIKKRREEVRTTFINTMMNFPVVRGLGYSKAMKMVMEATKGNYPAPVALVKLVKSSSKKSLNKALKMEMNVFVGLFSTSVRKSLMHVFLTGQALKKQQKVEKAKSVHDVMVIGAGNMGSGIAYLSTLSGYSTLLKEVGQEALDRGVKTIYDLYKKALSKRKLTPFATAQSVGRLRPTLTLDGVIKQDLIIEAAVEKMEVKKIIFKELESKLTENTLIATNTSALSITEMAQSLKRPENFIGLHFFNPAQVMPLVEIIPHKSTSRETIDTCLSVMGKMKKTVVVVKDSPGFLVNRILLPYMNEAGHLLMDGADAKRIDDIIRNWGMPMGPLELLDTVGVDIGHEVIGTLQKVHPYPGAQIFQTLSDKKELGKKTSKGVYLYDSKGNEKGVNPTIEAMKGKKSLTDEDILRRPLLMMINEAFRCLEEGVVDSKESIDIATIYGIGFPPFRGGLMKYCEDYGIDKIKAELLHYQKENARFTPCKTLAK